MNLEDYFVLGDSSLQGALSKLEHNHKQFLAVLDLSGGLIGTLTDGDIRRGLLKGLTLNSLVTECVNLEPVVAPLGAGSLELEEKFKLAKVKAIPILDNGRLVEVAFLEDFRNPRVLDARILLMAGGRGERLLPLTKVTPKPLIPINGTPVIDRIIDQFAKQGFQEIWISVHHLSEQIISHVGDGERFGVNINYIVEDQPLGTAGSLKLMPVTHEKPVLVCNADLFNNVNYREMFMAHKKSGQNATIGVTRHETQIPYGVVNVVGDIFDSLTEKPVLTHQVAAGVNIFNSNLVKLIPDNVKINIPDFYDLIKANDLQIGIFELHGLWIDIGTLETLERAKNINPSV